MKSNRLVKLAALVATIAALPIASHAADGTITFNGSITAQTCTINGNGAGSKDFVVKLPTVSASALASSGQTAGRTPFTISLSACTPAAGTVHTFFESGSTTSAVTGNLILTTGGATNVQIGLLNADLTAIKAGFADASQNSKAVTLASGGATLSYFAQYVATGTATAGAANSNVTYTIAYQ
jgi:major type 1 subunit fimbrin (pilin)